MPRPNIIAMTLTTVLLTFTAVQSIAGSGAFARFDSNQDNKLSLEEFSSYTASKFNKMDVDNDQFISKKEYKSHHKKAKKKILKKKQLQKQVMDKDQ